MMLLRESDGWCTRRLPCGAALPRLLEVIEEARSPRVGQRGDTVRLPLLFRVSGQRALRTQELDLSLHLAVPAVLVVLAHVGKHADAGNGLELGLTWLPHVTGEGGNRAEVLR